MEQWKNQTDGWREQYISQRRSPTLGEKIRAYIDTYLYIYFEYEHPGMSRDARLDYTSFIYEKHIRDGLPLHERKIEYYNCLNPEDILCFRSESRSEYLKVNHSLPSDTHDDADKFDPSETLQAIIRYIFEDARNAINNRKDENIGSPNAITERRGFAKSYSKSLIVPLFKYYNDNPLLSVCKLKTNTLLLRAKVLCFDRCPPYDANGDEKGRYHSEELEIELPLKDINNIIAISQTVELALQNSGSNVVNIVDIDIQILGYTLDVSPLKCEHFYKLSFPLKERASFQTDSEILNDYVIPSYTIKRSETIQLIRILTLLYIGKDLESYQKLLCAYQSGVFNQWVEFSVDEQTAVEEISSYLQSALCTDKEKQSAANSISGFEYLKNISLAAYSTPDEWIKSIDRKCGEILFKNRELHQTISNVIKKTSDGS